MNDVYDSRNIIFCKLTKHQKPAMGFQSECILGSAISKTLFGLNVPVFIIADIDADYTVIY